MRAGGGGWSVRLGRDAAALPPPPHPPLHPRPPAHPPARPPTRPPTHPPTNRAAAVAPGRLEGQSHETLAHHKQRSHPRSGETGARASAWWGGVGGGRPALRLPSMCLRKYTPPSFLPISQMQSCSRTRAPTSPTPPRPATSPSPAPKSEGSARPLPPPPPPFATVPLRPCLHPPAGACAARCPPGTPPPPPS